MTGPGPQFAHLIKKMKLKEESEVEKVESRVKNLDTEAPIKCTEWLIYNRYCTYTDFLWLNIFEIALLSLNRVCLTY